MRPSRNTKESLREIGQDFVSEDVNTPPRIKPNATETLERLEFSTHIPEETNRRFSQDGNPSTIRFSIGQFSLGSILVAASNEGICAIYLGENTDKLITNLRERFPKARFVEDDPEFERLADAIIQSLDDQSDEFHFPLHVVGTAFQRKVWDTLRAIPCGSTASYTDIAKRIGRPKSARAVAQACAANPLAMVIPCHRVIRADGSLSGYRWGLSKKAILLDREKENLAKSRVTK